MFDAIVVGGGPAGLQAALTLGRMHRSTLLLDSGSYRNGTVRHAHNLITHDGRDPAAIRRLALENIAAYDTVEVREAEVAKIAVAGEGRLAVTLEHETLLARNVVLATGLADELPPVPGLARHWGDRVANCPFCHGHEFAGERVALINGTPYAPTVAALLAPVVRETLVFDPAEVASVDGVPDGLLLTLADGRTERVAGVLTSTTTSQRAPFAAQLGLELQESGAVRVDVLGRTSVPGVYAAGDMAHTDAHPNPVPALSAAISSGQAAATGICHAFAAETVARWERQRARDAAAGHA